MKTDPSAACRFFTAEDACRIALKAYFAACRNILPPPGEPWSDPEDGSPWATPEDFGDRFNGELVARLALLHLDRVGFFSDFDNRWAVHVLAAAVDPEKMAPVIADLERNAAAIHDEFPEFFSDRKIPESVSSSADGFWAQIVNGLPPSENCADNRPVTGEADAE